MFYYFYLFTSIYLSQMKKHPYVYIYIYTHTHKKKIIKLPNRINDFRNLIAFL